MTLSDLLKSKGIDSRSVLVFRHRPSEPELRKVLPLLAVDRPDLFNAYQQQQGERLERSMSRLTGRGYVASFIARGAGEAIFVGLYEIRSSRSLSINQYRKIPENAELVSLGMKGFPRDRPTIRWFDFVPMDFYASWRGKLIVTWPPPERSWWRRAHLNEFPIRAILEEGALDSIMEDWNELDLTWAQLQVLPSRWKARLSEWRAIYYIFDASDGKGYVGSAYGSNNLLGRWTDYAATGHGGNRLLRRRDPANFRFSILERVSPDMNSDDVIRLESTWKKRLHSYAPYGLNEN